MKTGGSVAIAVVLVAVSAGLAHLHVVSQTYYPVVRLASPDGLIYTAVLDAKQERQACGVANERFLGPVRLGCKDCKVVIARCERQLEGFELAVHDGKEIPHHLVRGPGMRMAIAGPAQFAKASCEYIAGQMIRSGVPSAACVSPS